VCTYVTRTVAVEGSAKSVDGWFPATSATVYYDHPVHAAAEHTLNIDVLNAGLGPSARLALELDPTAARALAEAILATLEAVDG
jgi:hypothetical protein